MRRLIALLLVSGCTATAPAPPEQPTAWTADPDATLSWRGDGQRIYTGRHLFDLGTQKWQALPDGWSKGNVSPSGLQVMRTTAETPEGASIEVTRWADSEPRQFKIMHFLDFEALNAEMDKAEVFATLWANWLDETHLLVVNSTQMAVLACRILDLPTGELRTPKAGCPASEFAELYAVQPGPNRMFGVYSSGEGHPGVNAVTWEPQAQSPVGLPAIDLYPSGPLQFLFAAGVADIWLQTPCDLRIERGCVGPSQRDDPAPEYLFRWSKAHPNTFTLAAKDIPPGAVYAPDSKKYAWITKQTLCVGSGFESPASCVALPN